MLDDFVIQLACINLSFSYIVSNGVLTFERYALPASKKPRWMESQSPLCDIHLVSNATIEDMHGFLQVDFANEFIVS